MGSPENAHSGPRERRILVGCVLALAVVIGIASTFAVWIDRQTLNPENGTKVSADLLANEEIRDAVGTYLVDELFVAVDVPAELQRALPPNAQVLATPAAAGLRELADRAAPRVLARPRVQSAWERANFAARTALVRLITSDNGDTVELDLHGLITALAGELGLNVTVPPDAGRFEVIRSDQLGTTRRIARDIQHLAVWGTIVTFGLFGLAVYLAAGWRRVALRRVGWCMVALGLLVVLVRRVVGSRVLDQLVTADSIRSAAQEAWLISTQMLYDIAVAVVAYGAAVVIAAWLAGPTRAAVASRRALAPSLHHQPGTVFGAVAFGFLLVVLWGPTPALRAAWGIVPIAALLALGVESLRRQVARELPDVERGETAKRIRTHIAALRQTRLAGHLVGTGAQPARDGVSSESVKTASNSAP